MKLTSSVLAVVSVSVAAFAQAPGPIPAQTPGGSRLLCLFLDLRSLDSSDFVAARDQAINFVDTSATPADNIAIMTYTSQLNVLQDFTMDHDQLLAVLRGIKPGEVSAPDLPSRLQAIQAVAGALGRLPQKKAVVYFSTPLPRTGGDQPAFQAATRSLMDANIALYPVDPRGFQFK